MSPAEATAQFSPFLDFVKTLKGDEKSEAQTLLDHLFRALGHKGVHEAGATFEYRVAKKPGSSQLSLFTDEELKTAPKLKGGVKFADLLWPGRVLIEMKSRGEKLEKHYDQLFYYWSHIVPKRPPSPAQWVQSSATMRSLNLRSIHSRTAFWSSMVARRICDSN